MASKTKHTYVFKVSDDGTLKKVKVSANAAEQSLGKVATSSATADRAMKGAAQASSNSTKNFSKMAQGITGGLVPAYATLAANIFAVSALFTFLKSSADVTNLIAGQEHMATTTGTAYKTMTLAIKDAAEGMLGYKEAAQAAAIGSAAGLSAGQLTQLTEAATKASLVLGRDMEDSFNRIIRGVTKAEPELLDELGIILRLEDATKRYAEVMGITGRKLTVFEKQQAVANEVLRQANNNFGEMDTSAGNLVTSVSRLKASFDELLMKIQSGITVISPLIDFLADNTLALGASLTIMGTGLVNALMPAIPTFKATVDQMDLARKNVVRFIDPVSKIGQEFEKSEKLSKRSLDQLERSWKANQSTIVRGSKAQRLAMQADFDLWMRGQREGLKTTGGIWERTTSNIGSNYRDLRKENGKLLSSVKLLGRGFGTLLKAVPYIGLAVMAFEAAQAFGLFGKRVSEEMRKANRDAKDFLKTMRTLNEEIGKTVASRDNKTYTGTQLATQAAGATSSTDFTNRVTGYRQSMGTAHQAEAYKELEQSLKNLVALDARFQPFMKDLEILRTTGEFKSSDAFLKLQNDIQKANQNLKKLPETLRQVDAELGKIAGKAKITPFDALQTTIGTALDQATSGKTELRAAQANARLQQRVNEAGAAGMSGQIADAQGVVAGMEARRQAARDASGTLKGLFNPFTANDAQDLRDAQAALTELLKQQSELDEKAANYALSYEQATKDIEDHNTIIAQLTTKQNALEAAKAEELRLSKEIEDINRHDAENRTLGITTADKILNNALDMNQLRVSELELARKINNATELHAQMLLDESGYTVEQQEAQKKIVDDLNAQAGILATQNNLKREGLALDTIGEGVAATETLQGRQKVQRDDRLVAFEGAVSDAKISGDPAAVAAAMDKLLQAKLENAKADKIIADNNLELARSQAAAGEITQQKLAQYERTSTAAAKTVADLNNEIDARKRYGETLVGTMQQEVAEMQVKAQIGPVSEGYAMVLERINQAKRDNIVLTAEEIAALEEAGKAYDEAKFKMDLKANAANSIANNMTNAFMAIMDGSKSAKEAFADMAKAIIADIMRMIIKQMILNAVMGAMGMGPAPAASLPTPGGRYGGIFSPSGKSFKYGGVASGPESGYPATLHGREAVIPLGNEKSIPVEMKGKGGDTNNVGITVNLNDNGDSSQTSGDKNKKGAELGKMLSQAVQDELHKQKRPGGILSPFGGA